MYKKELQKETWGRVDIWEERGCGIWGRVGGPKHPNIVWLEKRGVQGRK